jgi:tRNA(Ile)-lysidine synthase TilS/MesJ
MELQYPNDGRGEEHLARLLDRVRRAGRGRKYDCVIGFSGGRDSTYTLYRAKREWGLRPLAVHFNDGFGNPMAGENMQKAADKLGVDLSYYTSDWRESKDLKLAFLRASTPDLEEGTDIGIAAALYGAAARERVKYILIGQSFRTEGISPLPWNYLDGRYLHAVHRRFGSVELRPWRPEDPGFNLRTWHLAYYALIRGIRTITPLYHTNYVRAEVDEVLKRELDWEYPGAHYFDDLYQSLMAYVYRTKFGIERRRFNYSALVRSGQMSRAEALDAVSEKYVLEDDKTIDLCIKRLGISREEFDSYMEIAPKTFRDYPSDYNFIRLMRPVIYLLSSVGILPQVTYEKYFHCG